MTRPCISGICWDFWQQCSGYIGDPIPASHSPDILRPPYTYRASTVSDHDERLPANRKYRSRFHTSNANGWHSANARNRRLFCRSAAILWGNPEMPMLEVHAPHQRIHSFKDFLLHLLTITIGLLIALGLEGCMERHHQRQLVQDAEVGLQSEIAHNADMIASLRQHINDEQAELNNDLAVLSQIQAQPNAAHRKLGFSFRWGNFDDVAWKTAQSTGAFTYMSYPHASTFSTIYDTQDELLKSEKDVTDEVLRASAFPSTQPDSWVPTAVQADDLRSHIGLLRMRLLLLTAYVDALDRLYTRFNSAHV
jgi:hypothetical protein